jgi:hypothetical protein
MKIKGRLLIFRKSSNPLLFTITCLIKVYVLLRLGFRQLMPRRHRSLRLIVQGVCVTKSTRTLIINKYKSILKKTFVLESVVKRPITKYSLMLPQNISSLIIILYQQLHFNINYTVHILLGRLLHVSAPCGAILRGVLRSWLNLHTIITYKM